MNTTSSTSVWHRAAPGLLLMLAAPLCTEVLPGATRLSSLFVLPIEILVWGGGALLIREVVRRQQLGWVALLLLGLALALAEECLIQQTSLAPLVIKLKGIEYARAAGVNYVYLLWALVYEAVFVVLVPVALVELLFPARAREPWVNLGSGLAIGLLFPLACFAAWYTWTQIARVKFFHLEPYTPPAPYVIGAVVIIATLVAIALYGRTSYSRSTTAESNRWIMGGVGFVGATLWYALVILAFGIAPHFSPLAAVALGVAVCVLLLIVVPRWVASPLSSAADQFAVIFGALLGSMLVSFAGFIGSAPADLWFKIFVDAVAVVLLVRLGRHIAKAAMR